MTFSSRRVYSSASHCVPLLLLPWFSACADASSPDETGTVGTDTTSVNDPSGPSSWVSTADPAAPDAATPDPIVGPADSTAVDAGPVVSGQTDVGIKCDRRERIGTLGVNLGTDRTIVSGAISNGVLPSSVPQVSAEGGGCQLLTPRNLFCSSCGTDEACDENDECVPKPSKISAGTVVVGGLLTALEVTPNGITGDYSKTILDPFPAYDVGAAITLTAAGDQVEAFTATLVGVPKLSTELAVVGVERGEPAQLSWDASGANPDQSAIYVTFSVNVHGAVTGWIECVAPDTGEFEIPSELVTDLVDLGLSGFPQVDLERRSSATVELTAGCVDVLVASKLTLDIEVDGLTSCNKDADCDDGQTCSEQLACE